MSIGPQASKALDMLSATVHGLDAIGELSKSQLGGTGQEALAILAVIAKVIDRIKEGFAGEVDAKTIHGEFLALRAGLISGNNSEVDSEIDKKFPR